jgi:hypothetical protein
MTQRAELYKVARTIRPEDLKAGSVTSSDHVLSVTIEGMN